jgi:hypothetical protein
MHAVFLHNYAILPTDSLFNEKDGYTHKDRYIGTDSFEEKIGPYRIFASAQKFRSEIAYYTNKAKAENDTPSLPFSRFILFEGSISIYQHTHAEIVTHSLEFISQTHGKIWYATPEYTRYEGSNGLYELVGGMEGLDTLRVESIIKGYEYQQRVFEQEDEELVRKIKNKLGFI